MTLRLELLDPVVSSRLCKMKYTLLLIKILMYCFVYVVVVVCTAIYAVYMQYTFIYIYHLKGRYHNTQMNEMFAGVL